jgi:ubiquinol-cytochrome c reductase cytochrome b subunit
MAAVLGPKGPSAQPDPSLSGANPRQDYPFLWAFGLLSLLPPESETAIILIVPPIAILFLFLVPFLFNGGERHPSRRPIAVLSVILIFTVLGVLTYQGATSPWSPKMTAWSGDAVPVSMVKHKSPLELQGAVVLQYKCCRNCHALDGVGGDRGPDLSFVGARMTRDELTRQVIQGGGNMPAYGEQLKPEEVSALVAFLVSLRPPGQKPAEPPLVGTAP